MSSQLTAACSGGSSFCAAWLDAPAVALALKAMNIPRPSKYPLSGPKYLLLMAIHPQLRVLGGSWLTQIYSRRCRNRRRSCWHGQVDQCVQHCHKCGSGVTVCRFSVAAQVVPDVVVSTNEGTPI